MVLLKDKTEMMRTSTSPSVWLAVALLAASGIAVGAAARLSAAPDPEAGFVSLFNGRDLAGWDGDTKVWSVKDGAIVCSSPEGGKRNWLVWRGGELEDFELRLRFRFTSGNSGVQVRSTEIERCWVRGYQVEVAEREKMGLWHHSLAPAKERAELATAGQRVHIKPDGSKDIELVAEPAEIQQAYRESAWNELTVIAQGSRLVQIINGVAFAELIDEDERYATRAGVLAFQDHGNHTVVEFKDIRLRRIEPQARPDKGGGAAVPGASAVPWAPARASAH